MSISSKLLMAMLVAFPAYAEDDPRLAAYARDLADIADTVAQINADRALLNQPPMTLPPIPTVEEMREKLRQESERQ